MVFHKRASVAVLATAVADGGTLRKVARQGVEAVSAPTARSYYVDGSRKIDVRGLLEKAADQFNISADPSDYIFEAIRANTTNVFNENHDGFHQKELWRFDLRLGMPVYQTYVGKGHFLNHRTENPKAARGVIVDAHYNADTPPLDACPRCASKTAAREARDSTGLHCAKCGTVVKDEFVEALVAVDTKKDPIFAEGVRTGQLRFSSMGCTCASTVCNVCEHVATSRPEFCTHIKAGNKGTLWARTAGSKEWTRIEKRAAAAEFAKRGIKFDTNDFCSLRADDGYEIRKAAEYCEGVEYDELSRVDQPADPKASQREILHTSAGLAAAPAAAELRKESEDLIKSALAAAAGSAAGTTKAAQYTVEQLQSMPPDELQELLNRVNSTLPDNQDYVPGHNDSGAEQPPESIQNYTEDELDTTPDSDPHKTKEELGVMPQNASPEDAAVSAKPAGRSARMYGQAYKDWAVEVTPQGTARVASPRGPVMLVRASTAPSDAKAFGREILSHLLDHGLLKTAERYNAVMDAKFAQVVDYAINDMQDFDDHYMHDSILEGGDQHDMRDVNKESAVPDQIGDGEDLSDMADGRGTPPDDTLEGGAADHERDEMPPPDGHPVVTKEDNSDMREKRKTPPMDALSDETHDHKERLAALEKHAARLEKVTAAKLAAAKKESTAATEQAVKTALANFTRALRIVAKRHARNLEISPLKEAFGLVLANERTVGHDSLTGESLTYVPVTPDVAKHLIEAAWKDGGDAQIDELLTRAAALAESGAEFLKHAEADISKIAHIVPPVTAVTADYTDLDRHATELRQAAKQGSYALAPSNDEPDSHVAGSSKRASIQAALGGSLTNRKRNQFGRPN